MSGSRARFSFQDCIEAYTGPGTDARRGCESFAAGEVLDVGIPADKHELQGVIAGLRAIADGIVRDAHFNKVPAGK